MNSDESKHGKHPVIFGEVLFDRFPDGHAVLGGAPFNVAWHLQAFGQSPLLVSRVGDDPLGREIRNAMVDWGMTTAGLQLDSAHATGTVEVSFSAGEPHYDIVDNRAYDFIDATALPPMREIALLYHGSLALRGAHNRRSLSHLLAQTAAPRFVDVNLRPPWWQAGRIAELISGASWLKLNSDELALLAPSRDNPVDDLRHDYDLQGILLTRGEQGADLVLGEERLTVAPELNESLIDTVGAGDAFTSVFLLGLLNGWPHQTTLQRAQSFASAIVGVRGATVSDREFYRCFSARWGI
ncbi:MAG: carbohydrate kinase [Gammaproteobacteria bacterium]|nr:carbohydrate kinase [Gammaproteobacteria bacterium]